MGRVKTGTWESGIPKAMGNRESRARGGKIWERGIYIYIAWSRSVSRVGKRWESDGKAGGLKDVGTSPFPSRFPKYVRSRACTRETCSLRG